MPNRTDDISLTGSISLGTGVMIGAGIFALVGQVAQFQAAEPLFGAWGVGITVVIAVIATFPFTVLKLQNDLLTVIVGVAIGPFIGP